MTPDDRIKELEAENQRLRNNIEALKAALQEVRIAWVEERLVWMDRASDNKPESVTPATVLPWKAK